MRLSIIIRTWNRLEYTIRTIVSISEKSGLNRNSYEIICVDQGSTDGTSEWLRSVVDDGYYPIRPLLFSKNVGDGLGMAAGIKIARGDFVAQHDNDILLSTGAYYRKMIEIYESLEKDFKLCALGGIHKQGITEDSAPFRFARNRDPEINFWRIIEEKKIDFVQTAWCTGSFIFRKSFAELQFNKGMCNSFCGEWFDRGYENILCKNLKFWHIDSTSKGGEYVTKQAKKFPNYSYIKRHYKNFI